ncbi:methyltransferase domain-containing protein [Nocardiopsis sp. FIRDI 009]|uniref:methyltransferase domain-containing protein n=1 Tax=Nocardiopsis sp. FIRDI 009 TaxID=714197 RepID=UPI000E278843|nr:methyltransferase domain-containing protein [Nocardiopsis sp. FIRDI 009]
MAHDVRGPEDLSAIAGPGWADAFRAVPREHFIPDSAEVSPMSGGPAFWIDRAADPERWRSAVYSDATILTQIDDGATTLTEETASTGLPSSSSTAPSIVVGFLELLDPYPGDRVLEIGTGTGWAAGLLSARLGGEAVTTVEVDEQVAKRAAANLEQAGLEPTLVVGDGALGHPDGAPYDRVHVTCGIRRIPFAWVEQTRPGGVIAVPWVPNNVRGHRLVLTVADRRAVGRLHGDTAFMVMRAQRAGYPPPVGEPRHSSARVDPRRMLRADAGFTVALAGMLPGVVLTSWERGADGASLQHPTTRSYASVSWSGSDGEVSVTQVGPRDLWDEVEAAYLEWVGWGSPGAERFGVTVDRAGQHVWVDSPENRVAGRAED